MGKIGFVAPYSALAAATAELSHELGLELLITEGLLEGAIGPAESLIRQGAEVIISRGGTAVLLRQKLSVPVVEIRVTGYDVIRALFPYFGTGHNVAIVGYQNVVHGCRSISELFGLSIHELIIPSEYVEGKWRDIREQVNHMISDHHIQVLIGDTLVSSYLKPDNLEIQLIESGDEAIIQAVEEAKHIARIRENERKAYERLRTIIQSVHEGIVATDEVGRITAVNLIAEDIFGCREADVLGVPVSSAIPNTRIDKVLRTGVAELEQLQLTPKGYVVTNRAPFGFDGWVQGVVATFQEVAKIQSVEQKIRQTLFASGLFARYQFEDILTEDVQLKRIIALGKKYAQTDATMLLLGESGTGKELFAQSVHRHSARRNEAFVAINCSALPAQILESELFGYEEGAFTGAKKGGKLGLFELAHNGTIFLDEIGDMNKELQSRLLRVLAEKQVMRLGSDSIIPIDVRVIAATNMDLWKEAVTGNFRLDLYYRLNVLNIKLPPLRERKQDILLLANHFLRRYGERYKKAIQHIPESVAAILLNHQWIGNIRELKNVMERIVLSSEGESVDLATVNLMLDAYSTFPKHRDIVESRPLLSGTLDEIKRKAAIAVLMEEGNNIAQAARRLQIDRNTLKKMVQV